MKINGATILGACIVAAGMLLLILAFFRFGEVASNASGGAPPDPSGTGHQVPYLPIGIGVLVCGFIIIFLGQYLRRSPRPTDPL